MKRKQYSVEQIVAALKQAELGMPVADLIRQLGISEQTYYRWKKQRATPTKPDRPIFRVPTKRFSRGCETGLNSFRITDVNPKNLPEIQNIATAGCAGISVEVACRQIWVDRFTKFGKGKK
jgi:hypothetical protein